MRRAPGSRPPAAERRRIAKTYVDEVRAKTYCEKCSAQPIEWHSEEHHAKPYNRVSQLVGNGLSIARIQQEIDACKALCRACHMRLDGRTERLVEMSPTRNAPIVPPKPCVECGRPAKPLRQGRCNACDKQARKQGPFDRAFLTRVADHLIRPAAVQRGLLEDGGAA